MFSRAESKRKQWEWSILRRDTDSKELTKLGLEMTEARGCVFRRLCRGPLDGSWDRPALAVNLFNSVTIRTSPYNAPQLCCSLVESGFKEQVFHCGYCVCCFYYFKCNYNSNAENKTKYIIVSKPYLLLLFKWWAVFALFKLLIFLVGEKWKI